MYQALLSLTSFVGQSQLLKLQFRDALDIFVIAILIYVAIQFLRETRSVPAFVGILSLLVLYGLAVALDLSLSSLVLRSLFGFSIIAIAIVFEKELRRFLSSFGIFGIARHFLPPPTETAFKIICDTVTKFARTKTGAIIVFPGRESIERFLEGGFWLKGEISEPLLLSIFSTASPGHDGAIVIENNLIERFGVHLPLAEHFEEIREYGLRHRAALGLVENSDALVVVVSEEKGIVNIARNGKIHELKDREELKQELIRFHENKFPVSWRQRFPAWFAENILIFGISLVTATGLWLAVSSGSQFAIVQRDFIVTPEFKNISPSYVVADVVPEEIALTFAGRSVEFEALHPENLRISADLSSIKKEGWHQVLLTTADVRLPFNVNLNLVKIDPPTIKVNLIKNATSSVNKSN